MAVILVDYDCVLGDFDRHFIDRWVQKHPEKPYVGLEDRVSFYIVEDYPKEQYSLVKEVYHSEGFYSSMPPVEGSLDAVKYLAKGHKVFICTCPSTSSKYCVPEKYEWVERHLGKEWKKRMIFTNDKTLVIGDYLIDDKPVVHGEEEPVWEHILYTRPWNQHLNSKKRLTWKDYKEVLNL